MGTPKPVQITSEPLSGVLQRWNSGASRNMQDAGPAIWLIRKTQEFTIRYVRSGECMAFPMVGVFATSLPSVNKPITIYFRTLLKYKEKGSTAGAAEGCDGTERSEEVRPISKTLENGQVLRLSTTLGGSSDNRGLKN